jgi:hypothetical protein
VYMHTCVYSCRSPVGWVTLTALRPEGNRQPKPVAGWTRASCSPKVMEPLPAACWEIEGLSQAGVQGALLPSCPHCLPEGLTGVGIGDRQAKKPIPPTSQPDSCGPIKTNSSQVFLVMIHAPKAPLPLGLFSENLGLFKFYSPTTSNPGRK